MKEVYKHSIIVSDYRVFCDKCGKEVLLDETNIFECELKYKTGFDYHDNTGECVYEYISIDLCESCAEYVFKELLQDFLIKNQ